MSVGCGFPNVIYHDHKYVYDENYRNKYDENGNKIYHYTFPEDEGYVCVGCNDTDPPTKSLEVFGYDEKRICFKCYEISENKQNYVQTSPAELVSYPKNTTCFVKYYIRIHDDDSSNSDGIIMTNVLPCYECNGNIYDDYTNGYLGHIRNDFFRVCKECYKDANELISKRIYIKHMGVDAFTCLICKSIINKSVNIVVEKCGGGTDDFWHDQDNPYDQDDPHSQYTITSEVEMIQLIQNEDDKIAEYIKNNYRTVDFKWSGEGNNILLYGNFDNWSQAHVLHNKTISMNLRRDDSVIKYKFVVDGEWKHDPTLPTIHDGYGGKNNIIVIYA
ncbi:MAG: SNF1-related kinase regulatory subunit beta-2 [Terrestrivirus sp.]|uniref:SNF1-related kinase regulatory subunit beta-2 n=1 Tax=Terrestrivirus sp. TaxID=2487775 RepID=A0A3G4ZPQ2_9VIRU|nr:MAG: SNF1-related kinase regulatory subunit beta-2 [Terrestrivirus sp.]